MGSTADSLGQILTAQRACGECRPVTLDDLETAINDAPRGVGPPNGKPADSIGGGNEIQYHRMRAAYVTEPFHSVTDAIEPGIHRYVLAR